MPEKTAPALTTPTHCALVLRVPQEITKVAVYPPIPKNIGIKSDARRYDKSEFQFLMDSMEAFKKWLLKF